MTRIFRSLRWRVQHGHIFAMCLLIPSMAFVIHQWWSQRSLLSFDKELALTMNSLCASDFKDAPDHSRNQIWYAVLDSNRKILHQSEAIPLSLRSVSDSADEGYQTLGKQRLLCQFIEKENKIVYVGVPEDVIYKGSQQFFVFTTIVLILLAILALVVAWWHSGKSLSPIQRFAKTARRMSESTKFEALDLSDTHNELQDLGEVLNLTFDRLHRALEQQKQLTADASHELRTPLTALIAQVKRGQSGGRSEEDYQSIFEICDRSLVRLKRIVDDLLELSRYDSGQVDLDLEELPLDLLIKTIAEDYRPVVEKKSCRIEYDISSCGAYCDPFRIEQVLSNLMMNAVRHNPDPVTLSLRVKMIDEWAVIEVEDDGIGIPPESHEHLFDRFFQEKKAAPQLDSLAQDKNSGLGLAISKAIVEAHGGSIEVRSEPEVATVFRVRLPMKPGS